VQACCLHCHGHSNLVRLTVTNLFILLSLLLELLFLPPLRSLTQQFVPNPLFYLVDFFVSGPIQYLLLFIDWEQHPRGHLSPQCILACDHSIGVPTHSFGISSWFGACFASLAAAELEFVIGWFSSCSTLVVSLADCWIFLCAFLFLWLWVQGGHSFEPIYWPFVGGLVGTVPNLHLDTGLLQFYQLTQAPAKGSAL